jgi:acetolactate synthase-1/3 small subunit
MERFIVELTVSNHCGVLSRITGLYSKRKYNIDALTVSETRDPELSVMRIVSRGDAAVRSQMARQLRKLYDVKSVALLSNSGQ